eukprot:12492256-Heterocapsa_arctica.AAC.1
MEAGEVGRVNDGNDASGPAGDAGPRLDPVPVGMDPVDEVVVAVGGGAGLADGEVQDVPPLVEFLGGAGASSGAPARLRLRSRGIRGHF